MIASWLILLDVLTVAALLVGLFFLFIGALGIFRLPDVYSRMHAASKCITLGISGMLLSAVFHFARVESTPPEHPDIGPTPREVDRASSAVAALTKAFLVIMFQFIAAPVAVHMLARAAHLSDDPASARMLSDELSEDRQRLPDPPVHVS